MSDMFDTIHNHVHHYHGTSKEDHELLHKILEIVLLNNAQNKKIMSDVLDTKQASEDLLLAIQAANLKLDGLQTTVDTKQAAIQSAIDALAKQIEGDPENAAALIAIHKNLTDAAAVVATIAGKLTAVDADVASTSTEATPDVPPAEGGGDVPPPADGGEQLP